MRILATGETDERLPYIAMDLADGRSLKEIVASDAPMASGRACNIIQQLLRALGAAHRAGIVHRDMKPDNIRVVVDADGIERPKILDFGVAKIISGDMGEVTGGLKTKTGIVLGTPKYMAPEQIRGEAVDGRADIYSVGAMFHEMLTGKPPFEAEDVFGFVAMHLKERVLPLTERFPDIDVSEDLDDLVLKMLAKDPRDRPTDAAALADEVAKFAVEDPRAAEKGKALKRGIAAVALAGLAGGAACWFVAPSVRPCASAASAGLGFGAALAARLFVRPSVYGFVRRLLVTAAATLVFAAASIPLCESKGIAPLFLAAAFALAALLSYAGYLMVWSSRSLWLRLLAAGVAAPLVAIALVPVLVRPADARAPYFVGFVGGSNSSSVEAQSREDAARSESRLAVASIAVAFGLASLLLPRPGAARK